MGLKLVRQSSSEPNITNIDDTIMTRYAYGGSNGVVRAFGSECNYVESAGTFKILDGRLVIDGWEVDIDGAGLTFDFSRITGTQYNSIYLEVNVSIELAETKMSYLTSEYPDINKGDDLTDTPSGTARLLLYNVKVVDGSIQEVQKKFNTIRYSSTALNDFENNLKNGNIVPKNSTQINGIEITKDENGVLRIGDFVIPQKKLIWFGVLDVPSYKSLDFNQYNAIKTDITIEKSETRTFLIEGVYKGSAKFSVKQTLDGDLDSQSLDMSHQHTYVYQNALTSCVLTEQLRVGIMDGKLSFLGEAMRTYPTSAITAGVDTDNIGFIISDIYEIIE